VSLLADTIHNFSDALTAVPLWIAFNLSRRGPNRRFTYGYGRAEDIAGGFIIAVILASALVAGYESVQRLLNPRPVESPVWVIVAAIIGFIGNELVAVFRMRVGKEINSTALIADGQHARTDGLTSLAVLVGAVGSMLGYPILDPIVGLVITVAILAILWQTGREVMERVMDAIEPEIIETIEHAARETEGVEGVNQIRARWLGHRLVIGMNVVVDDDFTVAEGHEVAMKVQESVQEHLPQAAWVRVHVDPLGHNGDPHRGRERGLVSSD
jgi:cation diffusion facilitator family transporter